MDFFDTLIFVFITAIFGSLGYAIGTPVSGVIIGLAIASLITISKFRGWVWGNAGVRKLAGGLIAIAVAIALTNIAIAIWSLDKPRQKSVPATVTRTQPQQPIIICVNPPAAKEEIRKEPAPERRIYREERPVQRVTQRKRVVIYNNGYNRSQNDWRHRSYRY